MLQSLLPYKPVMWNDLIAGADYNLTKFSLAPQSSFLSPTMLSGRESMTGKDDTKSESFTMGSADLGVLMADPYTEEDARILSTTCYFGSDDVDDQEEGMQLFGNVGEGIKSDYNWEQCFGNLEDVDNLLSSGPDLTFGPGNATSTVDNMQWHDSASPPAVLPENAAIAKSPLRAECGANGNGNLRLEFVPGDARGAQPAAEKGQVGAKTVEYMPADERWSVPQSGAQFMASDCLQDREAMAADVPASKMNGTCVGMDISEDGTGASSVSHSDSEKASIAQAQRTRRHAANRKRIEERSRRQMNHRKLVHGSAYNNAHVPPQHMMQPIPMQLPAHANHISQPAPGALYGFAAPRLNPVSMQTMMRPAPPYIHGGHSPAIRHIQPVPPTPVSPQIQQGFFMGYQQPCSFQPTAASQHQQFQLRPPVDAPICPPPSSSSMTPQEKIEKLRYLQQMQARFAVEQQQQQFVAQGVAQGVAPMDSSLSPPLGNVPAQLPQVMPVKQPDVAVTASEMKMSGVESDFEASLSVGQTSLETTSEDECGSVEAVVLEHLQSAMKSLEVETKLCIRDALYRLARSAMRRKGTGGRDGCEESCSITQASEDGDYASDGLETSINSDPCSSSRVSRMNMNMNMVETQTNPIYRSIAHLLFYKTQQVQAAPTAPNGCIVSPQLGMPDSQSNPSTWHQGEQSQNSWRPGAPRPLPATMAMQGVVTMSGVDMGATPVRPPLALVIPATPMTRFQAPPAGMVPSLITEGGQAVIGHSDMSSPMGSQCQPRANVEEQRAGQAQTPAQSAHKVSLECRNGVRSSKRLEHAVGLKELSQVLTEGLEVENQCGDETSGPPPLSNFVREEGQAGNHEQRNQPSRSYPSQRGSSILC